MRRRYIMRRSTYNDPALHGAQQMSQLDRPEQDQSDIFSSFIKSGHLASTHLTLFILFFPVQLQTSPIQLH